MLADPQVGFEPAGGSAAPVPGRLHRLLWRLEPERAHALALAALRLAQAVPPLRNRMAAGAVGEPRLAQQLLGLTFRNPVGLAAGFDKDGVAISGFEALGFGFVEVGTVTPRPQRGNPRPRLFRHPAEASLQNYLGFNNRGVEALRARLAGHRGRTVPLGINVGRNRDTPPAQAVEDYRHAIAGLSGLCDYFAINVSSPNTPGLRELQAQGRLEALLAAAGEVTATPLMVKLSPDLPPGRAAELALAAVEAGARGVILTNTTTDYSLLPGASGPGGLSGRVLRERSFALLCAVARELRGRALLVSVGGIEDAGEVYRRLLHGASLVQLYTALVYRGAGLPRALSDGLTRLLERDRVGSLAEIVGAEI